jgi:hypothetical protein
MKQFSEIWSHFVIGPTAVLGLAWMIVLRRREAKKLGISYWKVTKMNPPPKEVQITFVLGIAIILMGIVYFVSEYLASRTT